MHTKSCGDFAVQRTPREGKTSSQLKELNLFALINLFCPFSRLWVFKNWFCWRTQRFSLHWTFVNCTGAKFEFWKHQQLHSSWQIFLKFFENINIGNLSCSFFQPRSYSQMRQLLWDCQSKQIWQLSWSRISSEPENDDDDKRHINFLWLTSSSLKCEQMSLIQVLNSKFHLLGSKWRSSMSQSLQRAFCCAILFLTEVLFFFSSRNLRFLCKTPFHQIKTFWFCHAEWFCPFFLLIVMLLRKKFLLQFPKNPLLDFPESWLQHSICPRKLSQSPSFKELRKFKSPRKVECWWVKMTGSGV